MFNVMRINVETEYEVNQYLIFFLNLVKKINHINEFYLFESLFSDKDFVKYLFFNAGI